MTANGAMMIKISATRRYLCALIACLFCTICVGQGAQGHGSSPTTVESRSDSGTSFFGTSHDVRLGTLAWLLHLDKDRQAGEMFVAPRMMKLSQFELAENGTMTFQSPVFVGKEYRFRGTLKSDVLSGEMQLVNAKSGNPIDKWEFTAAPLPPLNAHVNSEQPVRNVRYSNVAYSSEGGDQTGVDIQFLPTDGGTTGMIVFYESYWSEPTFTPLALSQVTVDKGAIHFAVELPSGIAHYHLLTTPIGVLFNRDDVPHVKGDKDIVLKRIRARF